MVRFFDPFVTQKAVDIFIKFYQFEQIRSNSIQIWIQELFEGILHH